MCADMQVLDLGAYDAILGYDWLSQHSPMVCDWANYYVEFQEKDRKVKLQGIQPVPLQLQAISADSFMKWHKGNGIWATTQTTAPVIGTLLQIYAGVFAKPHSLPPTRVYDRCTK